MIEFSHLYKTYNNQVHALKNISFNIGAGEFVFLTGPSGAGKSTIFKMINAYDSPTSGSVHVANYDVSKLSSKDLPYFRRKLGIVFQDFKLLYDKTVFQNISLPLAVQNFSDTYIKKRVMEVLELVGLDHKKNQLPEFLSGGEQQRVAIARAIVHQPGVLIADEPTGNLDPEMSERIIDVFDKVCAQGTTVFIATHDLEMVKKRNKRVIAISNGMI
ncbi:MAG: cell division ATP-binding protein FtsE [Bdellovibrionales bacterium]|nr:cell division ATP-binding protein FtsE [Bdellovibrionales bacterium]